MTRLLLVVVPVAVVVLVQVDHLDAVGLASLQVLRVLLNDSVHDLQNSVRLLVLWNILSVLLELRQNSLALVLVNLLFEETILNQEIEWGGGVAVDLADHVRKLDAILFLGLINQLVE